MLERSTKIEKETSEIATEANARTLLEKGSFLEPANGATVPVPHIPALSKPTDVQAAAASMYLLPLTTRVPLKFGSEVITEITCARVRLTVQDAKGQQAEGWGETPLSVQWAWPSTSSFESRLESMTNFCRTLTQTWSNTVRHGCIAVSAVAAWPRIF